jgi:hypothetical protein
MFQEKDQKRAEVSLAAVSFGIVNARTLQSSSFTCIMQARLAVTSTSV